MKMHLYAFSHMWPTGCIPLVYNKTDALKWGEITQHRHGKAVESSHAVKNLPTLNTL